ncbi:MAG: delta-lactam-biosynthetic de-N-acetylase [Oscillospiraceae bacterium]|nr:delta-lactam-biosynthetic de-N-acetylase [Oscillospiraceae bacterium]
MKLRKIISFAIVLCLIGGTFTHAESTGWGLSFQENGQPPVGNAGAEDLLQYNAWYIGDTEQKTIYLTFDAGYENGYTSTILDVLKEKDVPAAFFVVGTYIEANPELVKRMADEGHIVANHTATHPDMSAISDLESFQLELTQTEELYRAATGKDMPKYYRPPRGVFSTENLKMAHELGYKTIFWSLAYVDWYRDDQPTQEEAFSKLLPRVHPGAIVLLHSTSQTNAEILGQLIDQYRSMGYTFGTLEEL